MSTILVTGASGFVGSHVVPAVIEAGHRVVALVHGPAGGDKVRTRLPVAARSSVETRVADVVRPDTLAGAFQGIDAVVHLVAIPRDWNGGADLRLVNTEGTRNVVAAARAAGVRRFVHQGAMGVEDDPNLHYASAKAKAEAIVQASGLDWTILKPSLMWGERDGFFNIIAGLVRWAPGLVPVPGDGRSRFQPLAVDDLARVVVQCLADDGSIGQAYLLGGPRHWTYREITGEVLAGMARRRLIVPMPLPLIRLVAAVSERIRLPFPVATDQLRQLRLDNIGPLDAVRTAFGWEPRPMDGQLGYLRRRLRDQEPATA